MSLSCIRNEIDLRGLEIDLNEKESEMCVWIWFLNVNIGKVGLNYFRY